MKGCLLIHGYTGGPFEVEELAKYLEDLGYYILCPTLPGHGGSRQELKRASYKDWLEAVDKAHLELSSKCDKIAVLGFSMGGLLASNLCHHKNVKCIVTMGSPIYCFHIKNLCIDIFKHIKNKNTSRIYQYINSCFTPLKSNRNFRKALKDSLKVIKRINIPIFVVHGKDDPVAHWKSAHYIYSSVSSEIKDIKLYNNWAHRFKYCKNPYIIYQDIGNFIREHLD